MLTIEKPKKPKVIKYTWWDGYNKEEVEKIFPGIEFSRYTVYDDDQYCATVYIKENVIWNINGGVYLCCEVGHTVSDIFTLSKKDFEEKYCNLPIEG